MKVPFHSRDARVEPFLCAVRKAAATTGILPEHAAIVISRFAEELVTTVSCGRAFLWPGVGMWAAVRYVPKKRDLEPHAAVRFAPGRTFRADTRATCSPHPACEEIFWAFAKRHRLCTYPFKDRSRAFTFQKAFRERVEAQLWHAGIDVDALLNRWLPDDQARPRSPGGS